MTATDDTMDRAAVTTEEWPASSSVLERSAWSIGVEDPAPFGADIQVVAVDEATSYLAAKRAFDICVSLLAILVVAPLVIAVFVAAKISEPGPVLFSQKRLGRNGRMFNCWKFRTMRVDADQVLGELLASDPESAREWAENHKLSDDPRVTDLGRFLRRFDLDELPQLMNVLTGDMSIVGPRPIVSDETAKFGNRLDIVLTAKPGLTGAWQVSGRNSMAYDERVEAEVRYVLSRSFAGDLGICFRTPLVLLRSNSGR